jgi:hypothetical protein
MYLVSKVDTGKLGPIVKKMSISTLFVILYLVEADPLGTLAA